MDLLLRILLLKPGWSSKHRAKSVHVLQMCSLRKCVKALAEKREQLLYAFLSFSLSLIFLSSITLPSSLLHPPNPFCLSSKKVAASLLSHTRR